MDAVKYVALHERGMKKVYLDVNQSYMDEIGSYVACIELLVAEICYRRFVRISEPYSTRLVHQLLLPAAHIKRP